jgi:uncharacterized protein (TIGR02145 family)
MFPKMRINQRPIHPQGPRNNQILVFILHFFFFIFHSSFVHAQIPSYVPTNGLVGWWPFNGNANDESGTGNHLTNTNGVVAYASDRNGVPSSCVSFNGSGAYLSKANPLLPTGNSNRTYSAWVKVNSNTSNTVFSQNSGSCNNYAGLFCGIDGAYFWGKCNDRSWGYTTTTSEWNHIVLVYANSVMYCYRNGILLNPPNSTYFDFSTPLSTNATSFFVGYPGESGGSWPLPMNGLVDDIAIYNRAITQQEVTNLYTNTVPAPNITVTASTSFINCGDSATLMASTTTSATPCAKVDLPTTLQNGLVGYWPFCGNASDGSGNGNNGTVNGATLTSDRFGSANGAYSFDGNSRIYNNNTPLRQIIDGVNSFSVGIWFSRDSSGNTLGAASSQAKVLFAFDGNNSAPYKRVWATLGQLNDSITQIQFVRNNSITGMPEVVYNTDTFIEPGTWNHLIVTFNGTLVRVYLNNSLLSSIYSGSPNMPISILGPDNNVIGFTIADNNQNNLSNFSGKLDDITIYNRALSASEIQQLYTLNNFSYVWSTGATTPSISVTPSSTNTYTCTATNSGGSTTSSVTVNVADSLTWTGAVDTDWHKPCNWSPQFVPKCCNNVSVPVTINQPIVSGIAAAEDLTIYTTNGALVTVNNGANLQIADCPTTVTTAACPSLAVLTTTAVSSITQTTAVSGGTITYQGASAITARGVCWSTSVNPTLANSFTTNGTGTGTFISNLIGLTAGETYYVRAYATNGSGTSYGNQVSFVTPSLAAQYPAGSVFCASGPTEIVDVTNPTTGKTWMDRNLGASQVATSSTDAAAYGDLYQWGRRSDGHQCRSSATTTSLSSINQPANGNFILAPNVPYDWRTPQNANLWQGVNGVNNPCPIGYRLPTEIELDAERLSWSVNTSEGAFGSQLKLPMAGGRNNDSGLLTSVGASGGYWSSTFLSSYSRRFSFLITGASTQSDFRANGRSVRCIKDASAFPATIGALNCGSTTTSGTLAIGAAASGVSASVPYTGGNGGSYAAQSISSTGVTGLTASLISGILVIGSGSLSFAITGTPNASGTASFSLTIGGQSCSFTVPVLTALAAQYPAGSIFCASGPTAIVEVTNPATGKTWMDRNLGATQVATSSADAASYGDLYQWGRRSDGHQCRTSATTATLSSTDTPANGNFILAPNAPNDWRSPQNTNLWQGVSGINNPCPSGYRLPTEAEWTAEDASFSTQNVAGAFASPLKLPMAGNRNNSSGSLSGVETSSNYWSSTVSSTNARSLNINNSNASLTSPNRAFGCSVRCIKN